MSAFGHKRTLAPRRWRVGRVLDQCEGSGTHVVDVCVVCGAPEAPPSALRRLMLKVIEKLFKHRIIEILAPNLSENILPACVAIVGSQYPLGNVSAPSNPRFVRHCVAAW